MKLYNSLHRQSEEFTPIETNTVKLYTCGPTVYDFLHVGNWASYIYWDILVRSLELNGLTVQRVMNITDVGHLTSDADDGEDKLEKGAKREGKTAWEVAAFYTEDFLKNSALLNLKQPNHLTKATDYIPEQLELIQRLEAKEYTYVISDGVYFDTSKFPTYADFARLNTDALKAGARVEYNTEKRNVTDFALWKFSPKNETRDMEWESPWGKGFPGWHLECSAMAMSILGDTLDIHTGGIDHIPVHHTNEIAQSEAASGVQFSRFWLHNNHLKVNGTKISKSLQNGFTLQDVIEKGYTPDDLRLFVLQSHYRKEGNFTWENLAAAKQRLNRWKNTAERRWQGSATISDMSFDSTSFLQVINDDLDTPGVIAAIDSYLDTMEKASIHPREIEVLFSYVDELLGFSILAATPDITTEQKNIIQERHRARQEKEWQTSDTLRDELRAQGIQVNDTDDDTIWYRH